MIHAIKEFINERFTKGFLINPFRAPTSCIVLIMNLFEYIDILIVLFINTMDINNNTNAINEKSIDNRFMFLLNISNISS